MAAKRSNRHHLRQSGFTAVAGLFVPRTRGFRRIFLVVVLISISLLIPYPFSWIALGPALIVFLFTPAFVTGLVVLGTAVSLGWHSWLLVGTFRTSFIAAKIFLHYHFWGQGWLGGDRGGSGHPVAAGRRSNPSS